MLILFPASQMLYIIILPLRHFNRIPSDHAAPSIDADFPGCRRRWMEDGAPFESTRQSSRELWRVAYAYMQSIKQHEDTCASIRIRISPFPLQPNVYFPLPLSPQPPWHTIIDDFSFTGRTLAKTLSWFSKCRLLFIASLHLIVSSFSPPFIVCSRKLLVSWLRGGGWLG